MRKLYNRLSVIFLSVLLFGLVFGTGYFVGGTNNVFWGNGAGAQEPLNLNSFWKAYYLLEEKFVSPTDNEITEEEKVFGAISGLVESYNDPYTTFLPPVVNEQFEETISGTFEGIGAEIGIEDNFLTIIAPLKDSPAETAGLRAGDKIIAIDGETAIDLSVENAIKKIRGEKGTVVSLTVIRKNEKDPITIEVIRNTIFIPTLDTEIVDDVFVISLYNFSATAPLEFREALREFIKSKKSKMILDLRGNPGGFLNSAVEILSWYLPAGKTVAIEDFGQSKDQKKFRSKGYNIFNDNLKMAIIIDKGSASASEIVAGALGEYGIATLVGENTFGKGSVQELVEITENTSLKVTIARWLTPEGKSISNGGLTPDIEIEFDIEKYEEGIDVQLQKAIEVLK